MTDIIALDHATPGESIMANKIVDAFIAEGCAISVYDGEEFTVIASKDRAEILKGMATTGEERLIIKEGHKNIGYVLLIYGNADDGSELAADWVTSPTISNVMDRLTEDL